MAYNKTWRRRKIPTVRRLEATVMNRRILLQLTAPTVLIGAVLFGACLASVLSINRLQANLARILSENVTSLQAAQELEIQLRQLRFHSFLNVINPNEKRQALVESDHAGFEEAMEKVRQVAKKPDELALVQRIQVDYQRYRAELAHADVPATARPLELARWADAHPIGLLQEPCQRLLALSKHEMEQTAHESEEVSGRAQTAMLLAGLLGPVSGLIVGFGIARALSRSIARLSVRLEDARAQLDQEVASVKLSAGSDLGDLDRQLDRVVERVRAVAEQVQRQQAEMLRSEQLAAVGQLAASVAHEVRNPLTSIKMLVGAAMKSPATQALTPDDLGVICKEVARLEQTVQGLLDFARPSKPQRQPADLRAVVGNALDLVRARARQQGVRLDVRQPDEPVVASVDSGQLNTVLVNLLLNALDAQPHGGVVEVALRNGRDVQITVDDDGPGIAAAVQPRLFTPFASTKPTGTGLGLSICRRVLQEHGGTIVAQNRPDGGACFPLALPATNHSIQAVG
jgi:two-component system, NtrC family, sensor histidine kinase HydH